MTHTFTPYHDTHVHILPLQHSYNGVMHSSPDQPLLDILIFCDLSPVLSDMIQDPPEALKLQLDNVGYFNDTIIIKAIFTSLTTTGFFNCCVRAHVLFRVLWFCAQLHSSNAALGIDMQYGIDLFCSITLHFTQICQDDAHDFLAFPKLHVRRIMPMPMLWCKSVMVIPSKFRVTYRNNKSLCRLSEFVIELRTVILPIPTRIRH